MLDPIHEDRAKNLRDDIKRLRAKRADARQAKELATLHLKSQSRLRDRYRWLLWLGGNRAVYDRVLPLRMEIADHASTIRQIDGQLKGVKKRIGEVVEEGLSRDPDHRKLLEKQDAAKRAVDSCTRALAETSAARKRIRRASSSTNPRDAGEVAKCIQAVRKHVADVNENAQSYGSVSSRSVKRMNIEFSGAKADASQRVREFRAAEKAVDDVARNITSILNSATRDAKELKDKRRKRVKAEQARFA